MACTRRALLEEPQSRVAIIPMPPTHPPYATPRAPYPSFLMSFRGAERTAKEVHATLCAMVTTQAAAFSAWAVYESVLLDAETANFFATRLSEAEVDSGESNPPSKKNNKKKRKLCDDGSGSDDEADGDPVAVVCEHCGGAVPEVTLRVACLDGSSLDVTVAQRGLVREVKRLVGQVRFLASSAQRSFVFVMASALLWRSRRLTALLLVCRCATWTRA
jgi:hypothetical protein